MPKCTDCIVFGYCPCIQTRLVTDRELDNPDFLRDVRNFAAGLPVPFRRWQEYLNNEYRDYSGAIIRLDGEEVFLDMDVFEKPNIDFWFRNVGCAPCPQTITPRVQVKARERVRVMATILRARNPKAAMLWGRLNAANDNNPE